MSKHARGLCLYVSGIFLFAFGVVSYLSVLTFLAHLRSPLGVIFFTLLLAVPFCLAAGYDMWDGYEPDWQSRHLDRQVTRARNTNRTLGAYNSTPQVFRSRSWDDDVSDYDNPPTTGRVEYP